MKRKLDKMQDTASSLQKKYIKEDMQISEKSRHLGDCSKVAKRVTSVVRDWTGSASSFM